MHILWYSGVELPAVTGGGLTRAGWQEGLRRALFQYYPQIQLSIASFGRHYYQSFRAENATYYNILRDPAAPSRWKRVAENWKHRTFQREDLERSYTVYRQIQPDLVFIFGTENPFGLLTDRFSVPVVISIQAVLNGLVPNLFQGLSFRELAGELLSRNTLTGQGIFHKWWSHRKSARIEKQIYRRNSYFCGRTAWDRNWQERLNPGAHYFHVDRVLGEDYYRSVWEPEGSEPQRIFSLAGNAPFKGGITLVRGLALLKSRGYDRLQLHLAGVDGDSMVGKNITKLIQQAGLEGQVSLLGRLGTSQIIQEMQAASLFVLPSHLDNSPNSLAEAMILGMPCVASNAGGIPSMLQDGREGLIYPHQDVAELARRIEQLLTDPVLAHKLGRRARETALARHDPEKIARATVQIYQQVLAESEEA